MKFDILFESGTVSAGNTFLVQTALDIITVHLYLHYHNKDMWLSLQNTGTKVSGIILQKPDGVKPIRCLHYVK